MKLFARREPTRLHALTIVLALLALIALSSNARAGDGVQYSGDCDRTYVNKQVGSNEQWAITWEIYGSASGNVFKLDGSAPSFIECELVDQDDDNEIFDCYGSSACTGPPCGDTQWSLIGTDIPIPTTFFLPPGVDPADAFADCEVR